MNKYYYFIQQQNVSQFSTSVDKFKNFFDRIFRWEMKKICEFFLDKISESIYFGRSACTINVSIDFENLIIELSAERYEEDSKLSCSR